MFVLCGPDVVLCGPDVVLCGPDVVLCVNQSLLWLLQHRHATRVFAGGGAERLPGRSQVPQALHHCPRTTEVQTHPIKNINMTIEQ